MRGPPNDVRVWGDPRFLGPEGSTPMMTGSKLGSGERDSRGQQDRAVRRKRRGGKKG